MPILNGLELEFPMNKKMEGVGVGCDGRIVINTNIQYTRASAQ